MLGRLRPVLCIMKEGDQFGDVTILKVACPFLNAALDALLFENINKGSQ